MHASYSQPIYTGNAARDLAARSGFRITLFMLLHIPLALLMDRFAVIATIHALVVLVLGLWWALSPNHLERVAYVIAYLVGTEVLWRMTGAKVFWEFGKYAIVLICVISMLRRRQLGNKILPLLYFLLLLPSMILTITQMSLGDARQQISFNLSGPLSLFVSAWFFSKVRLTRKNMSHLFLFLIFPIVGIAAIAVFGTLTAQSIRFNDASNFVTSGGFGPNQVSAVLGLGTLCCLWYILDERSSKGSRFLISLILIMLATQSALTFSRGGLYIAGGSAALAMLYLIRDTRTRLRLILLTGSLVLASTYLVVPQLDKFTDGAISQRFKDTNLSARDTLLKADLQLWREHPVLGVGLGGARNSHAQAYFGHIVSPGAGIAAHTEFSRMLAEHGIFGLVAIMLLVAMSIRNVLCQSTTWNRAFVVTIIAWGLLFMLGSAMRIAAPSIMFGLSFAAFEVYEQQ